MFSNLFPENLLALTLLISLLPLSLASPVEARSGSVCSTGIYKDLLFLELYPPAETWCSAHYPPSVVTKTASAKKKRYLPTVTVTATVTVTVKSSETDSPGGVLFAWLQAHEFLEPVKRQATTPRPIPTTTSTTTSTTTTTTTTTTTPTQTTKNLSKCTGTCAIWSSCTKQGGGFLSTLCSCIENHPTTTITPTSSTITTTTTVTKRTTIS